MLKEVYDSTPVNRGKKQKYEWGKLTPENPLMRFTDTSIAKLRMSFNQYWNVRRLDVKAKMWTAKDGAVWVELIQ
jgi:hypothetical protein